VLQGAVDCAAIAGSVATRRKRRRCAPLGGGAAALVTGDTDGVPRCYKWRPPELLTEDGGATSRETSPVRFLVGATCGGDVGAAARGHRSSRVAASSGD
jgi:hypothetical protein